MKKALSLGLITLFTQDTSSFQFNPREPYTPGSGNAFDIKQPQFSPYNYRSSQPKKDSPEYIEPEPSKKHVSYGRPGADGYNGKDGAKGEPGPRGSPGPYGKPGKKGDKGDRGYPGKNGKDGNIGKPGIPGKPGKSKSGKVGPKGNPGKPGQPGLNGKNGINGKPGKPGAAGMQGEPGINGKDGSVGRPGIKGDKGVPGRDGPKGPPGPPGKARSAGKPGPPGPPGPPGDCGCGNKKRRRPRKKRSIEPVGIDTGIAGGYGNLFGAGYGSGIPLSGKSDGYGDDYYYYAPKIDDRKLPKRYSDGYDPKSNANYKVSLPDGAGVAKYANLGNNKGLPPKKGIRNVKNNDKKGEEKKFAKEKGREKHAEVVLESDIERKNKGYSDNLAYAGADLYEDAAAAEQKYVKGEAYVSEGDEAYRKDSLYGGDALYQQDDVATNAKVAFEVDHSLRFKNDYNDENHRGQYKGDEFEVAYKASDVQGGYSDTELDREKKAAAYQGANAQGEFAKAGKYYGDDYYKYGKDDKDLYYKDRQFGDLGYDPKKINQGGYPSGGAGGAYGGQDYKPDLYAKFKGDGKGKPVPVYGKGKTSSGKNYYPYGERLYIDQDKEQDDKYRGYGANFEGKDMFLDKKEAEAYGGATEKAREKVAFDKGNYRDVAAKGKNKQASYAGDYQTNKKAQNVDYNVKHFEDLQQDLQQDIKSDQYYAKYEGEDNKFARDADKKYGKYQDAEIKRKQDALINAKRYNGKDFSNKDKVDTEAYIYLKAKEDEAKKQKLKAKPEGYRPQRKKRYQDSDSRNNDDSRQRYDGSQRYGRYGGDRSSPDEPKKRDEYGPDMFKNRDYKYYSPKDDDYRRRMMVNEVNELKLKISSLKLSQIASKKDIIYISTGLVFSALFGALSFIGIMKLSGYSTKKVVKKTEDNELLIESDSLN